jgi:hypothetical protein
MGKIAKILPPDRLAIAEKNGIPLTTVYKRLQRGWDVDKAITEPPRESKRKRDDEGQFIGVGKGKPRSFTLPKEWDEKLDKAISLSNLSPSECVAQLIVNELKKMNLD